MNVDDALKVTFGSLIAALIAAVAKLFDRVRTNREDNVAQAERIADLQVKVDGQLTTEQVRAVIDDALNKRDVIAAERRQQWDDLLTFKIRQAVMDGVQQCQLQTKQELEELVPRIIRRTLEETGKHRTQPKGT